ncbi:MAG: histidine kinase [Bacteroidales bacterium]|nr:histidine kinase [Bacteroidales bacterium]
MKKHIALIFASLGVLLMLLYRPLWELFVTGNTFAAMGNLNWTVMHAAPFIIAFYVCYIWLIPVYLFENKHKTFWAANLVVFLAIFFMKFPILQLFNPVNLNGYLTFLIPNLLTDFLVVGTAIGIRYYIKSVEDLEKERENQQAELQWLKNQLNPHFLFNTMNNISSQIYTNPDEAQENLARLSDTLRYALYETASDRVPLHGEIEFMENYIYLMKLRCSDKTTVVTDFPTLTAEIQVLPLLYISLIENAFKHGISNKEESFIKIALKIENNKLIFEVENSNFPKKQENRSGHGIGIGNLKRRLELAYPDKYKFTYGLNKDGNYQARLTVDIEN